MAPNKVTLLLVALRISSAKPPVWPPATRKTVSGPVAFQPVVLVSKPGFATRFALWPSPCTDTGAEIELAPTSSVTIT